MGCDTERAISYYVYHILKHEKVLFCIIYELWRRRSHMINIILRGMLKGWWYRYQSRQTNTDVMFFQYYICKFPLFSTKYMINREYYMALSVSTRDTNIIPRALAWGMILVEGWYGMWYRKSHIILCLSYT
jgi:hypothetical protein